MSEDERTGGIEAETIRRLWPRILPLIALAYFCAWLDRVNVSFAALQMNADLGLSKADFGFGAGSFAIGYALFAIPSTLLLHRFGARRWIASIMLAWGLCSASLAFVSNVEQFVAMRFLLGVAEAGLAPGIILYFSYWFPREYRGRALGLLLLVTPVALVIGGPISGALLTLGGQWGLAGWQWLFLVEAAPSLLSAPIIWRLLPTRPADAPWLPERSRTWLDERLAGEAPREMRERGSAWRALRRPRVAMLMVVNVGIGTGGAGTLFFMPLMVQSMGFSDWQTGLMVALPAVVGGLSIPLWGLGGDRTGRRDLLLVLAGGLLAAGLAGTAVLLPSPWAIGALALAMAGYNGVAISISLIPYAFLAGTAAAAAIAAVNVAGNLGNFTGPYLVGWIADAAGAYQTALAALAAIVVAVTLLAAAMGPRRIAGSSDDGRA